MKSDSNLMRLHPARFSRVEKKSWRQSLRLLKSEVRPSVPRCVTYYLYHAWLEIKSMCSTVDVNRNST